MNDAAPHQFYDPLAGFDFRLVKPSLEQKEWMVCLVIEKVETAATIARMYNFNRKSLHKMVRRKLRGIPVRFKKGRPRVLDGESHDKVNTSIADNTCGDITCLKQSIRTEFVATRSRRFADVVREVEGEEDLTKISRRSLKRYVQRLHPGVFSPAVDIQHNLLDFEEPAVYWM